MKVALTLLALTTSFLAHAAAPGEGDWPKKPVRLVVGFPPGGAADTLARGITPEMGRDLGQPVIVENRPGATANIGIAETIRSPKDGYTLLLTASETVTTNPILYKNLSFNPEKDLIPIASVATVDMHLAVNPKVGVNSIGEFLTLLKNNPGKYTYSSPGQGSASGRRHV